MSFWGTEMKALEAKNFWSFQKTLFFENFDIQILFEMRFVLLKTFHMLSTVTKKNWHIFHDF